MSEIITTCICPPIPTKRFDWVARFDGYESVPVGFGETEDEAVEELLESIE